MINKKLDNHKKLELIRHAYLTGQLNYKVYGYQQPIYEALWGMINNPEGLKYYLNCARRFGKSTIMTLIAIEYALRNKNSQIRFAAPTGKMLRKITFPIIRMLLKDCPEDLMPVFNQTDNVWTFFNGSQIHLSGTENGTYENLRGTASHLNLVDECGFMSELDTIIKSVLIPQTLTTGGKTILASTPPTTPAHDSYAIAMDCMADGFYQSFTVHDNKSLTPELIAQYAKESGGFDSSTWKREYLVQWVIDEELQVIPEWNEEFIETPAQDNTYPYHHRYTSIDLVVKNNTAILFGYYNHSTQTLVIQAEAELKGSKLTTQALAKTITEKEAQIFDGIKPHRRLSDNKHPLLLADLGILHQLHFKPETDDIITLVNEARILVLNGRLRVDPSCTSLIANLQYGVWEDNRKSLGSSTAYNNFSHLKALLYMIRKIDENTNPVPAHLNVSEYTHFMPQQKHGSAEVLKRMFGLTRRH